MAKLGDRVLAHWPAEVDWWYAGVVCGSERGRLLVVYDDGQRAWLTAEQIRPLKIDDGQRVFGRYQSGPSYFPGVVGDRNGHAVFVQYDDGDEEWTSICLLRVQEEDLP